MTRVSTKCEITCCTSEGSEFVVFVLADEIGVTGASFDNIVTDSGGDWSVVDDTNPAEVPCIVVGDVNVGSVCSAESTSLECR